MTNAQNAGAPIFCQRCGNELPAKALKCGSCNAPVIKAKSEGGNKGTNLVIIIVIIAVVGLGSIALIGILAAIALPNFIGAQDKAREASVKANMRTVQIAAEAYASDNAGSYPTEFDTAFKSYFPGGSAGDDAGKLEAGKPPINPYTAQPEWPVIGNITEVESARSNTTDQIGKGVVEYSNISGTSYAIRGGTKEGLPIKGDRLGTALVLSNQ